MELLLGDDELVSHYDEPIATTSGISLVLPGGIIPVLPLDQEPVSYPWFFYPIYKRGNDQKFHVWQIGFDGSSLVTIHGIDGGALQRAIRQVNINTSGRTLQQQALLEARSAYNVKFRDDGYRPPGSNVHSTASPMLCARFELGRTALKEECIAQWKLDGIRWLVRLDNGKVVNRTRTNIGYNHFGHITKLLEGFFAYLPGDAEIDGELYKHNMPFTQLISIIKRIKNVHNRIQEIEYWIFDVNIPVLPYIDRYNLLVGALARYKEDRLAAGITAALPFGVIPSFPVTSVEDVPRYCSQFEKDGYEGVIIRKLSEPYRPGRTVAVYKYKTFIDEEAIITGVTQGEGIETGLALFEVKDIRGNIFTIRPQGSHEERAEWFASKTMLIGKKYTIRYQQLSEHGVPRFPVGITFRDYE